MNGIRIVGICLVRNEDLHIRRVIGNVLDFCDELIVLDNRSTDDTSSILADLAATHSKIRLHEVDDPLRTHAFVEPYAGTRTWVFKVDADEIYDPARLRAFRTELLTGSYREYFRLDGPSLNCISLDTDRKQATGYLSPPSKIAPNLYNFDAIESWTEPRNERLHGHNAVYRPGYDYFTSTVICGEHGWDDSTFRCLHLTFVRRSSLDRSDSVSRPNPQESTGVFRKALNLVRNLRVGTIGFESSYKNRKYAKGPLVTKDISAFFID